MSRVLVSTHDLARAGKLRDAFREEDYRVELVTPTETLSGEADPVLLVLSSGAGTDGTAALVEQARNLDVPVIGYGSSGAPASTDEVLDVFPPTTSAVEVALVGKTLVERERLKETTGIVGETETMREVLERVVQIAPVDSTVLVTGESGTGKELVARGIHALSRRKHQPFIAVNVAALPDTLLESELFGHEKGAFTGAVDARRGLFELADRGTIFLDEIGEMPLSTQTKLLRVLEQREFLRVGGERDIRVDVRIIAATNQDLRRQVNAREFRRDLYFRLNVLNIELPPLRERREDVPRLIRAFVQEASERLDRPPVEITPEAMEILKGHSWPGNVRELRNLVESMVVLAPGREIRPGDIPPEVRRPGHAVIPAPEPHLPVQIQDTPDEGLLRSSLKGIFDRLLELRIDVDDLRREFEAYREEAEQPSPRVYRLPGGGEIHLPPGGSRAPGGSRPPEEPAPPGGPRPPDGPRGPDGSHTPIDSWGGELPAPLGGADARSLEGQEGEVQPPVDEFGSPDPQPGDELPEGTVVFRPGTTMEEMEREAIAAALRQVEGNRRQAAEMLGIGERTLYRKIKRFGLEEVGS